MYAVNRVTRQVEQSDSCRQAINKLTLVETLSLFSWKFIMASEILTSIGSITVSILNGPSNLSTSFSS